MRTGLIVGASLISGAAFGAGVVVRLALGNDHIQKAIVGEIAEGIVKAFKNGVEKRVIGERKPYIRRYSSNPKTETNLTCVQ